jgi:hypothetical protein
LECVKYYRISKDNISARKLFGYDVAHEKHRKIDWKSLLEKNVSE